MGFNFLHRQLIIPGALGVAVLLSLAGCKKALFLERHENLALPGSAAETVDGERDPNFDRRGFLRLLESAPSREQVKAFYRRPTSVRPRFFPLKRSYQVAKLGEKLFFDPRLSTKEDFSCASCHIPEKHFVDGLRLSAEGRGRKTMSLYNVGFDKRFNWDGGAHHLTDQSVMAMAAPMGMNANIEQITLRLMQREEYKSAFKRAYGRKRCESERGCFSPFSIAVALEHYVRQVVSPKTSFDDWIEGDEQAISEAAKAGFDVFNGKADCAQCHNSWRFSDGKLYDVALVPDTFVDDQGVAHELTHKTKAVGLRMISERAPYTSVGMFDTLEQVVEFYNKGGHFERESKSEFVKPLGLSDEEQSALVAFMQTL